MADPEKGGNTAQSKSKSEKVLIRCKHWPKCSKPDDQCEYVHPKEECKFFPKCTYGEKCIYVHPDVPCRFGDSCTRYNCNFKHSKNHKEKSSLLYQMKPWLMMAAQGMMKNPSMFINNFNANPTPAATAQAA